VLFENCKRAIILQCLPSGHCLKLIHEPSVFAMEQEAYRHLLQSESARCLFLPIYFFCEFRCSGPPSLHTHCTKTRRMMMIVG